MLFLSLVQEQFSDGDPVLSLPQAKKLVQAGINGGILSLLKLTP